MRNNLFKKFLIILLATLLYASMAYSGCCLRNIGGCFNTNAESTCYFNGGYSYISNKVCSAGSCVTPPSMWMLDCTSKECQENNDCSPGDYCRNCLCTGFFTYDTDDTFLSLNPYGIFDDSIYTRGYAYQGGMTGGWVSGEGDGNTYPNPSYFDPNLDYTLHYDNCDSPTELVEGVIKNNALWKMHKPCPNGCINGACIPESSTTTTTTSTSTTTSSTTTTTLTPNNSPCSYGDQCQSDHCIEGTCRYNCQSYNGQRCSRTTASYTSTSAGLCVYTNAAGTSSTCDTVSVAYRSGGGGYYSTCGAALNGGTYYSIYDNDVNPYVSASYVCALTQAGSTTATAGTVCRDPSNIYRSGCTSQCSGGSPCDPSVSSPTLGYNPGSYRCSGSSCVIPTTTTSTTTSISTTTSSTTSTSTSTSTTTTTLPSCYTRCKQISSFYEGGNCISTPTDMCVSLGTWRDYTISASGASCSNCKCYNEWMCGPGCAQCPGGCTSYNNCAPTTTSSTTSISTTTLPSTTSSTTSTTTTILAPTTTSTSTSSTTTTLPSCYDRCITNSYTGGICDANTLSDVCISLSALRDYTLVSNLGTSCVPDNCYCYNDINCKYGCWFNFCAAATTTTSTTTSTSTTTTIIPSTTSSTTTTILAPTTTTVMPSTTTTLSSTTSTTIPPTTTTTTIPPTTTTVMPSTTTTFPSTTSTTSTSTTTTLLLPTTTSTSTTTIIPPTTTTTTTTTSTTTTLNPLCTDNDGDSYYAQSGCGTEIDLDDDPAKCGANCHPGIIDESMVSCADGYDNDYNGDTDCEDNNCWSKVGPTGNNCCGGDQDTANRQCPTASWRCNIETNICEDPAGTSKSCCLNYGECVSVMNNPCFSSQLGGNCPYADAACLKDDPISLACLTISCSCIPYDAVNLVGECLTSEERCAKCPATCASIGRTE